MAELLAFTAEHVSRLTGLSEGRLRYWDRTRFFAPTQLHDESQRTFGRIYSFRDVVGLRTIAILRKRHKIPLQELRRVGAWLHQEHETPWASLKFFVAGRSVAFIDPKTGRPTLPGKSGQTVLEFALEPVAHQMQGAAEKLRERRPDQIGKVVRNRYVVHNAHVMAGTRVTTKAIWSFHLAGYDEAAIIREYPRLAPEDVRAAIDFESSRQVA